MFWIKYSSTFRILVKTTTDTLDLFCNKSNHKQLFVWLKIYRSFLSLKDISINNKKFNFTLHKAQKHKCLGLKETDYWILMIKEPQSVSYRGCLQVTVPTLVMASTCCWVGTSPVTSSQNKPSGKGSFPPLAVGSSFWHSGIL